MVNSEFFDFAKQNLESIHSTASHKGFLGREFLTWLWFFSEAEDGSFEFSTQVQHNKSLLKAKLWIDDRIVLTAKVGLSHDHTIKGGNPGQCQEAAIALRHGKNVRELRVAIDVETVGMYTLTLNGDDLNPRAVQLPDQHEDTEGNPIEQRIQFTTTLSRALDHLMAKFMDERAGKLWETQGLENIRTWIKTRAQGRDGSIH